MAMMYVHPPFRDTPEPEAKLWRYLSFAKFVFLLHSARLHFTRVDHFDDHFEGVWPQTDVTFWTSEAMIKRFNVVSFTEQMKCNVAASCWIELKHESAAMWRLYAPGKEGVAVVTSFAELSKLVDTVPQKPGWLAGAARVRYIDHLNQGLIDQLEEGERLPNTMMPFMLKNISYEHEKQVRALICRCQGQIPEHGFDLPLSVSDFIHEIVLNPLCQAWFEEAVVEVADRFGLRSKIHKSSLSRDLFYMKQQQS